jgi:hypothetical protein
MSMLALLPAMLAHAQVMAPVGTMPGSIQANVPAASNPTPPRKPKAVSKAQSTSSAPASSAQAPSLQDKPAQPAVIHLKEGRLSIQADNSALDDILHAIAAKSGMQIQGLNKDYRVFGQYGPANPREVLSELLSDSGFNIVMLGKTADGTPRQLLLTARGSAPPTPPNPDDPEEDYRPPAPTVYHNPEPAHPAPSPNQAKPGAPGNGVRTPQQILQELEQMHQQQQPNPPQ